MTPFPSGAPRSANDGVPPWSKTFRVRWADLDLNGHVRSTAYSDLAATARVEFFAEQGLTPARMVRLGVGPVLFEEHQVFHRETQFGEELEVTLMVTDHEPAGQRATVAHQLRDVDGGLRATVIVVGGWMSLQERRIVPPPEEIANVLARISR